MGTFIREKDQVEISVLKRFGLRISILEAWEGILRAKGVAIPSDVPKTLASARVKVSSGCFTACDVGCELRRVEGNLISAAGILGEEDTEPWLDMLGECMAEKTDMKDIEKNIQFPAVRTHLNRFRFDGACGSCDS